MEANIKKVEEAIGNSVLKISYKMKCALFQIAKNGIPIDCIDFFLEKITENQHGKGYADGAEVYYKYTSRNKHSVINFDGEILYFDNSLKQRK